VRFAVKFLLAAVLAFPVAGQDLAEYFGFTGLEIVKVGRNAGPAAAADMDDDGLTDLVIVNNYKSRIEVHYQKSNPSPEDVDVDDLRPNQFPEHWRYDREVITVSHRVGAIVAHDYDQDGLRDLVYVGDPPELVLLRQISPGVFEVDRRHRVKGVILAKDALRIADVVGDEQEEIITVADQEILIWSFDRGSLSRVETLSVGAPVVAVWAEDFDGNGRLDIAGVIPDDPSPLRLWLAEEEDGRGVIGAQVRFEMPSLREFEPVRLPGEPAARLSMIERPSKRLIVYKLVEEMIEQQGDRDAAIRAYGFSDPGNADRDVVITDIDGDGLLDLVASDTEASAVVVYRQLPGKGLQRGESFPSLAEISALAADDVDGDGAAELFVLSEEENVVGRSEVVDGAVEYPVPITIPDGKTPVAMNVVTIENEPRLALALKDGRRYTLALVSMDETEVTELGSASRSPDAVIGIDADQNGLTDLLLLTRDKPMTMLYHAEEGFELRESKDMGQFGLVQAASSENTAIFDIDEDGDPELLIADRNFIRAVRYDPDPPAGVSPGWQVVEQINAGDADARLVSVAVFENRIIAADEENDRLVVFAPDAEKDDRWAQRETLRVSGFRFSEIFAGGFSGDRESNVLAIGEDGFAVIRLAGERVALRETDSWRSADERLVEHELTSGDVNNDGFTDLIALDAAEQMLELFTFTELGQMLYADAFKTFESRIFSGGEPRVFEPSQSIIADVTGDGANDIILVAHDRVLIYPQMTKPKE